MADVAVVTDSTACLPAALVDSLDITVVSLYFDVEGSASPESGHEMPGRGLRESEFDGDMGRFFAKLDASKTVARRRPPPSRILSRPMNGCCRGTALSSRC